MTNTDAANHISSAARNDSMPPPSPSAQTLVANGTAKTNHTMTNDTNNEGSATEVTKFYKNKNVLVTGATGFLGKVLVWKLYESCPDIGKIYVLMRSKNNLSADKRLIQMLKAKPFSFKYDYTSLLDKFVAIESDITSEGLGLSQSDRTLLEEQVNIVFHCAASVRFDAPLKDNMRDNLYGTQEIIKLCNSLKRLDSFVHVSTAYSNCNQEHISEELSPLRAEPDKIKEIVETMPDDALDTITDKLLEGRPNTYTYTKALAEQSVAMNEGKYPIAIVRPSIVISAAHEPSVGWVDNVNGIAGLGCLAAIGLLRTIDWNYYARSDMVPVDYVANCLICAAKEVNEKYPKELRIYNMTSGNVQPVSWGVYFEKLRNVAIETPPSKIVRPMIHSPKYRRANPFTFLMTKLFSELLFAYFVDMILVLIGYKKIMLKITKKMHHGYSILLPFTTNEWDFDSENVLKLSESLEEEDQKKFFFDLRKLDWDDQAFATWHGGRTYLLKEEPTKESYNMSKGRQRIVTIVHYAGMVIMAASIALVGFTAVNLIRA